jgi:hydroxymethylpyrimidine pyrophosphatase-like HAD family hydrolase
MLKIGGDVWVFCDIDDTLVMWNATNQELDERGVLVTCPGSLVSVDPDTGESLYSPEWTERLLPHRKHIEQLKKHKMRGHTIVVWSAGGVDWAYAAANALGLAGIVDLAIGKPAYYYDDLLPDQFMGKRYYFKGEE